MGRKTASIQIDAYLSNHNSEQDKEDRATWDRLVREIADLIGRQEYSGIEPELIDRGSW